MSGKIVMIGSMKGGVSKTVTTFNLAYSLSKLGKKVLAVDFDSQANLSTCLGVENVTAVPVTIGNLMLAQIEEEELPERSEYIQTRNGVDYISSSMVLSAVDAKLRLEMGSEKMLSDILETLRDSYDYILIDTSPSLGALTINAMSAADEVKLNVNHPFYQKVINPLCGDITEEEGAEEYNDKAKIKDAIMLLLLSYAKATAKFPEENQDLFNNLVVEWGTILNTVVKKLD